MSREILLRCVNPVEMALGAAVTGNTQLFQAIVEASDADVSVLSEYTVDDHFYCTSKKCFLLYKLVERGHFSMFKVLVEQHNFALDVKEQWEKMQIEQQRAWQEHCKETGLNRILIDDDTFYEQDSPYHTDGGLLKFAEEVNVSVRTKLSELRQKKNKISERVETYRQQLAGKNINEEKLRSYEEKEGHAIIGFIFVT